MSRKYIFLNPSAAYFVPFATVKWKTNYLKITSGTLAPAWDLITKTQDCLHNVYLQIDAATFRYCLHMEQFMYI